MSGGTRARPAWSRRLRTVVVPVLVAALLVSLTSREAAASAAPEALATAVRVERERTPGPVYGEIGGHEQKLSDAGFAAWLLDGGRSIAYSGPDGAGGFENEGQSLWLYDVPTRRARKLVAARYVIDQVTEFRTRSGRSGLLLDMRDGGLGAHHLAVVDPRRGEVFARSQVRILRRAGDTITVGEYREGDWERLARGLPTAPASTRTLDLDAILAGRSGRERRE
jgi:hypothetical protein